jgi:L-asparaginase II
VFKSEVITEITRGPIVESFQIGDVAVCDVSGNLLYYVGDPEKVTYMRSSAKPFQAIPYIERKAHEKYGFTDQEVAVTCASHSAMDEHVTAVLSILKKIGLDESYLQCGTHMPIYQPAAKKLILEGKQSTSVHSNCSGKHAGMLTLSQFLGANPKDYLDLDGTVQKLLLQAASDLMDIKTEDIIIGIDGCGAPVFGVPLQSMATGFARLSKPSVLYPEREKAVETISRCMRENPLYVAGTGRFTTDLMANLGDRVLAKSGAEACYCFGLVGRGIGVAFKVADGTMRAEAPIVLQILAELGVLTEEDEVRMTKFRRLQVRNFRGDLCGEIRSPLKLHKV